MALSPVALRRLWRGVVVAAIGGLVGAAALAIIAIASGVFSLNRLDDLLGSLFLIALTAATMLASILALSRGHGRIPAIISLVASPPMLVLLLLMVWKNWSWPQRELYKTMAGWSTVIAIAGALGALLALTRLQKSWQWVRTATNVSLVGLALLLGIAITGRSSFSRGLVTSLYTVIIIAGCGVACVPLLHWLNTLRARSAITTRLMLSLTCPRCGDTQEMPAGGATCRTCKLRLLIEIEEERCANCGYALYRLTSANCPECGAAIPGLKDGVEPGSAAAEYAQVPATGRSAAGGWGQKLIMP